MGNHDVEQFNARAGEYENSFLGKKFHAQVHQAVLQAAAGFSPAPRAVLDVGCGTGALLRRAAARFPGARLSGADPAERMIEVAAASFPAQAQIRLMCAPAERLPFQDAEFDLVLSTSSFHHWADQQAGIKEVARVLAPGGKLILTDPFAIGLLRPWAALIGKRKRMRTRREVEDMLRHAGLEPVEWRAIMGLAAALSIYAVVAQKAV